MLKKPTLPVKLLFLFDIFVAQPLQHELVILGQLADATNQLGVTGLGLNALTPDVGAPIIRTRGLKKRDAIKWTVKLRLNF